MKNILRLTFVLVLLTSQLSMRSQFCYSVSATTYSPDPFNGGTNLGLYVDDVFSGVINIPFSFCYGNAVKNQLIISTNGYVSFNTGQANAFSDWDILGTIPTNNPSTILNSILGCWEDLDITYGGDIYYATYGTSPNRRFVISFNNVTMFQCHAKALTGQIRLFEGTNNIDIQLASKEHCPNNNMWNGNLAIEGLNNSGGGVAVVVAGRNATVWGPLTNDAYLFTYCGSCVLLPVELASFDVDIKKNYNELSWTTEVERDNDYFTLERSSNAVDFTPITKVKGSGTTYGQKSYIYKDPAPPKGMNYYRIKSVSVDGKEDVSATVLADNSTDLKEPVKYMNMLGYEVDENYKGVILIFYNDGSIEKKVR